MFTQWFWTFWKTLCEISPFLLFGFFIAGVLHVLIPSRIILWALGKSGWQGAIRGSLIGTPLPLCSCSVIPTSFALHRQGASLSATTAFTIATPETSIDALILTAALLPSAFLGLRPLASITLAILVGYLVERFSFTKQERLRLELLKFAKIKPKISAEVCKVCGLSDEGSHQPHGWVAQLVSVIKYAFHDFFNDVVHWLLFGIAIASLIETALPNNLFQTVGPFKSSTLQVSLAILVGIPLYSCAAATTPLVATLISKGLSVGAGLALLLAGPATNLGNVFLFRKEFGIRTTFFYYFFLILFCWVMGVLLNVAWPYMLTYFPALAHLAQTNILAHWMDAIPRPLEIMSGWTILLLTVRLWVIRIRGKNELHQH